MSKNLTNLFDELDQETEKGTTGFVRAPFGYAGSKLRSMHLILPMLPYTDKYIEPFGGSASVLLNRKPSKMEVFNDRYAGVVAFYRCMREEELTRKLVAWVEMTVHSKEDFIFCQQTWQDVNDPVERAGRWLYMMSYSFSGVGRNWGRAKDISPVAGKLTNRIPQIWEVHRRFKRVQVENQGWYECMTYYDSPEAVFYCDPPYLLTDLGAYRYSMSMADHKRFLDTVFQCQGFVAVSGYPHELYDKYPWSDRYEYPVLVTSRGSEGTKLGQGRSRATEVLWIKD